MKRICLSVILLLLVAGVSYSQTFPTKPDIPMVDGDGNIYIARWFGKSETIGAYWTTSNLWSTRAGNGQPFAHKTVLLNTGKRDSIPAKIVNNKFSIKPSDHISYYEGEGTVITQATLTQKEYAQKFGLMYTWHQAIVACPKGWHLPTEKEWKELARIMGGIDLAGGVMRGNGGFVYQSDRDLYKWGGKEENEWGFNGLPAGHIDAKSLTQQLGISAVWWTTTNGVIYGISYRNTQVQYDRNSFYIAASVRCVKD
ncbi:fibrobacter succinogenes major paralogous domain-containing protein [Dysgonomonas sp. 25]|uniref:FISUMP domain-containing protein n=1 Tax=Dysgonomonas sp. 25 TaxID=2302933 RepID=UPI0013D582BB|nr:fibrobacter succinogenes major paralogous domain-containing protein [Dysgonomonas sp. 25]NDV68872.1 hypothetical protein [Dysgonomonas sp. 25]